MTEPLSPALIITDGGWHRLPFPPFLIHLLLSILLYLLST